MEEEEEKAEEWELLPPNTSFIELGLEDIKDLFSKEIDYTDYFIEPPPPPLIPLPSPNQKPSAIRNRVDDEESLEEIRIGDPNHTCSIGEVEDDGGDDTDTDTDTNTEDLSKKPRPRPLVAGISEMLSIGAAVAAAMLFGFLLGSGRRKEELRRADAIRFCIYKDDKALKQMVRQANRINQVLVATASGMPPPVMQPATISFGGCFGDML